jgi:SAM-dependent methyltransferase
MVNLYSKTAWLYDLRQQVLSLQDIDFYTRESLKAGGVVLELSCGTGRVTIPLATAGVEIWGIDLSTAMLGELEKKRSDLPEHVQNRLHIVQADMTDFRLGRVFPLIIIPASSFILLHDREQQEQCLECVRNHLADGGVFIMDIAKIGPLNESWLQPGERPRGEAIDPHSQRRVRQFVERKGVDVEKRKFWVDLIFYVEQSDGPDERYVDQICQTYFSYHQITTLLTEGGFKILKEIGDFDGTPLDRGKRMIFFCTASNE